VFDSRSCVHAAFLSSLIVPLPAPTPAWEDHKEVFAEQKKLGEINSEWPVRAVDLNRRHQTTSFKTAKEQDEAPYPPNVSLKAFLYIDKDSGADGTMSNPFPYDGPALITEFGGDDLFDITIVERKKMQPASDGEMPYVYTVTIPSPDVVNDVQYISGVPHSMIVFVDGAQTGDQFAHEFEPFRHYIGIDLPEGAWRNVEP